VSHTASSTDFVLSNQLVVVFITLMASFISFITFVIAVTVAYTHTHLVVVVATLYTYTSACNAS